jgi:hypothetical protein
MLLFESQRSLDARSTNIAHGPTRRVDWMGGLPHLSA